MVVSCHSSESARTVRSVLVTAPLCTPGRQEKNCWQRANVCVWMGKMREKETEQESESEKTETCERAGPAQGAKSPKPGKEDFGVGNPLSHQPGKGPFFPVVPYMKKCGFSDSNCPFPRLVGKAFSDPANHFSWSLGILTPAQGRRLRKQRLETTLGKHELSVSQCNKKATEHREHTYACELKDEM